MKRIFVTVAGWILSHVPLPKAVQNFIMWPLASRLLGSDFTAVVTLRSGLKMRVGMEDMLNRALLFKGRYLRYDWEPVTIRLVEILASRARATLIAGSHIGYTVVEAAHASRGRVLAVEPVRYLYERSAENIRINAMEDRIALIKAALGDKEGQVSMYVASIRSSIIPYSSGHSDAATERVRLATIDTLCAEADVSALDLIFLDIEGYELHALKGAERMLSGNPDLILEVCPQVLERSGQSAQALYEFLQRYGYDIYIISDEYEIAATDREPVISLVPIASKMSATYARTRYFNILATHGPASELTFASITS